MISFVRKLFTGAKPALSEAGPHDAAAIAALHANSFHRGWSEEEVAALLLDRSVIAHRAIVGATFAGFLMSRQAADEAEILSVAVDGAFRGRGLARDLLHLHLRRLAGLGIRKVFLEVDENNEAAVRLYGRAGFHEVSRRSNYYTEPGGKSANALVLRRDLP
ncbi:MAG TPA: ribosomal protein S18-alanine N-acetyltransferase [Pseudolabrys sp.]|nr:ribosomal protein S18-alanine N-acetyltransferase [Pseudolabrys sp.]